MLWHSCSGSEIAQFKCKPMVVHGCKELLPELIDYELQTRNAKTHQSLNCQYLQHCSLRFIAGLNKQYNQSMLMFFLREFHTKFLWPYMRVGGMNYTPCNKRSFGASSWPMSWGHLCFSWWENFRDPIFEINLWEIWPLSANETTKWTHNIICETFKSSVHQRCDLWGVERKMRNLSVNLQCIFNCGIFNTYSGSDRGVS